MTTLRNHTISFIACLALCNTYAMAQEKSLALNLNTPSTAGAQLNSVNTDNSQNTAIIASMPVRAAQNFDQSYSDISNLKWSMLGSSYIANFLSSGAKTSVVYDKKGALSYTIRHCDVSEVPDACQKQIRKEFGDYKIADVKDVNSNGNQSYLFVMDGASDFLILKYADNTLEDVSRVKKMK